MKTLPCAVKLIIRLKFILISGDEKKKSGYSVFSLRYYFTTGYEALIEDYFGITLCN